MSLIDTRNAIAAWCTATFPGVRVFQHGGRMSMKEVERWATGNAPVLVVILLDVPKISIQGGMTVAEASWAICALVRAPTTTQVRDPATLALISSVLAYLPGQCWSGAASKAPEEGSIRAENQYSPALDAMNVSLWGVTWKQRVDLPIITSPAALADFLRLMTTYEPEAPVDATVVATQTELTLLAATTPSIITDSPLPAGTVGVAYSQTLVGANGNAPYAWSIVGSLPAGLLLSGAVISGIPTLAGVSTFTAQLTDALSTTVSKPLSLTIGAAP